MCESKGTFSSVEHIVPHSLGNDILVLPKGWVCDNCNNICSSFESRVLLNSILGIERCQMGVITKKNKPARSQAYGLTWFSEPQSPLNILSVEADWKDIPILFSSDKSCGKIAIPFHDESNYDIARLLLKIGIEIFLPIKFAEGEDIKQIFRKAKAHIIDINTEPWPYFILRSDAAEKHLVSFLESCPNEHDYIKSCGFDAFFHEINNEIVLYFT